MAEENEISDDESCGNETNLSNLSASKRSIRAGYLTFGGVKKGNGNTKKIIKAVKSPNYLTPAAKKAFNYGGGTAKSTGWDHFYGLLISVETSY